MHSTPRKETGWVVAGIGVAISMAVSLRPERLNAPAWVAHLAAGAFILGGLIIVFRAAGRSRAADGVVCLLLAVFACIGAWIALGPGGDQCTAGYAGVPFEPSATSCRVAFGAGTLIVTAMLSVALRNLLAGRSSG